MKKIIALVCFLALASSAFAFSIAVPGVMPQHKSFGIQLLHKHQVHPIQKENKHRNIRMSFETCV